MTKDELIIWMGDELLRMSRQLSKLAEKTMPLIPNVLDVMPPATFHEAVKVMLVSVGEDPNRPGLLETPERVRKAWEEMLGGYRVDVKGLFKLFKEDNSDEMVIVRDITFTSVCEHHLLPFLGVAHVGYIPKGQIIGLSKIARIVDAYARRLQVQERITTQVTAAFTEYLPSSIGAACTIKATHLCMHCRGIKQPSATAITTSLTGAFREDQKARNEFMQCVSG